jgi:hypothetical protein
MTENNDRTKRLEYMACTYSLSKKIRRLMRENSEFELEIERIDPNVQDWQKEIMMHKYMRKCVEFQREYDWIQDGTIVSTHTYDHYCERWTKEWKLICANVRTYLAFNKDKDNYKSKFSLPIIFFDSVEGVNELRKLLPPTVTISDVERNRLARQICNFHVLSTWLFEINPKKIIQKIWGIGYYGCTIRTHKKYAMYVEVRNTTYSFELDQRDVREFLVTHKSLRIPRNSRNFSFKFL